MSAKKRRILTAVLVILAAAVIVAGIVAVRAWQSVAPVFSGGGRVEPIDGRINIALLGSDAANWRDGARVDSITVISMSADTGRAVVVSIPREIVAFSFPASSPLRTLYPSGYLCPDQAHSPCMLTTVYQTGLDHRDLYPGVSDPGAQATAEAVEGITGLGINYYAMIDMDGFTALIDAIGGIDLMIKAPVVVGAVSTVFYTIEPGPHHFDGKEALWYARTRMGTTDYDRMTRQKCVMMAVLQQTDATTVATRFMSIADATGSMASTSIPADQVPHVASLAMKAKSLLISALSLTPPTVDPLTPDYARIRSAVARAIAASLSRDAGTASADEPDAVDLQTTCGF